MFVFEAAKLWLQQSEPIQVIHSSIGIVRIRVLAQVLCRPFRFSVGGSVSGFFAKITVMFRNGLGTLYNCIFMCSNPKQIQAFGKYFALLDARC